MAKARGGGKGKAGWPGCRGRRRLELRFCAPTILIKERERGCYLPKTVTRSEVTGNALEMHRFARKWVSFHRDVPVLKTLKKPCKIHHTTFNIIHGRLKGSPTLPNRRKKEGSRRRASQVFSVFRNDDRE
ncbi:hypothetical protein COP2_002110 [Malus domestica]